MATIILHHGLGGLTAMREIPSWVNYWRGIDLAIAAAGHRVVLTRVHPTGSIERRAAELKAQIVAVLASQGRHAEPVVVLAHSMGGMDARYMIRRLDMASRVAALVTIGTGHRGSAYIEWLVQTLNCCGQLSWINATTWDLRAFWEATRPACARFNARVPDARSVRYFSVAGVCPPERVPPLLMRGYRILAEEEGPNDTHVSLASARWGHFLGSWPMHHFHLINWPMAQLPGDSVEDVTPRYLALLRRVLPACGLGMGRKRHLPAKAA